MTEAQKENSNSSENETEEKLPETIATKAEPSSNGKRPLKLLSLKELAKDKTIDREKMCEKLFLLGVLSDQVAATTSDNQFHYWTCVIWNKALSSTVYPLLRSAYRCEL